MTESELRAFSEGIIFELYANVDREARESPNDDISQRLGRAFEKTLSCIDFSAVTVKLSEDAKETPIYKEWSEHQGQIYLAEVALRFGVFLASKGVQPGEERLFVGH